MARRWRKNALFSEDYFSTWLRSNCNTMLANDRLLECDDNGIALFKGCLLIDFISASLLCNFTSFRSTLFASPKISPTTNP